ncbi:MAG: hypothetical protein RJA70_2126 [Pseudomonadota bacterium]|jgi:predicted lipoprotein
MNPAPRVSLFCTCLLLSLTAAACGPTDVPDARRDLLQSWGDTFLFPTYSRFKHQTAQLAADSEVYCAAPSEKRFETLQAGWQQARESWKQSEVFSFGPTKEFPWRLEPKIDFWPARPDTVEQRIELGGEFDADQIGAAGKGFPAIEWLLYGDPGQADLANDSVRCRYLGTITEDLARSAEQLLTAWEPQGDNYLAELTQAGRGSESFDSLRMALSEVVNRMGFLVENIRSEKLGKPLGSGKSNADPTKTESQFSGRSFEDIKDNLMGLERLYFGHNRGLGLRDYLAKQNANFDEPMRVRLEHVREAIDRVPSPLTRAILESPQDVVAVTERLSELQRLIQIEVVNALSLTLAFNENDGD